MKTVAKVEITTKTNQLVIIRNNQPVISHKIIAERTGNDKSSVARLIKEHSANLKEFGVIGFEIQKPKTENGGRPSKEYFLNEDQATFLMTLLKNTKQVVEFKLNLVKAFRELKNQNQQLQIPVKAEEKFKKPGERYMKGITHIIQAGLEYEKEIEKLKKLLETQQEEINELKLKLEKQKNLQTNIASLGTGELLISIGDFAKEMGISRRKMFEELRHRKFLKLDNKPYKRYLGKLFVIKDTKYLKAGQNYNYKQTFITADGLQYLKNLFQNILAPIRV